jgi:hypothetical protein
LKWKYLHLEQVNGESAEKFITMHYMDLQQLTMEMEGAIVVVSKLVSLTPRVCVTLRTGIMHRLNGLGLEEEEE